MTPADLNELRAELDAKCAQLHAAAPDLLRWGEADAVAAFRSWHESYQECVLERIVRANRDAWRAGVVDGGKP